MSNKGMHFPHYKVFVNTDLIYVICGSSILLSLGIIDEQLLKNVASRISSDIHQSETIP